MEWMVFDAENFTALGGMGWLRVVLGLGGFLLFGGFLFALAGMFAIGAVRAREARERLTSLGLAAGTGALLGWAGSGVVGLAARTVFASDDDFTAARLVVDEVVLDHAWRGEVARFPASELVSAEMSCRAVNASGEEGYECERKAALTLADGRVLRVADRIPWGIQPCPGGLDPWVDHGRRLVAASGRPDGLRVAACAE